MPGRPPLPYDGPDPARQPYRTAEERRRRARESVHAAVAVACPSLRVSYDARLDFLTALVAGAVFDEPFEDELSPLAWIEDEDTGEVLPRAELVHGDDGGPPLGFAVEGAFAWDLSAEALDAPVWATPRFDVPSLALRAASVGEIMLAAQRILTDSTPDVIEFDLAVDAGADDDLEGAERHWRACLACGEMKAHYGLGYTLSDLGRPREAFGHLAMYTEVCPRNAWAWAFRGRAAHRMGEAAEARRCYETALVCERAGSEETDAITWLDELDHQTHTGTGPRRQSSGTAAPKEAMLTTRFSAALEYARAHHATDLRKGTAIPYLSHLLAVSALVLEHGGDETAAIAALLHDVVEDGGGEAALAEIDARFGADVAAIVAGCSDTTAAEKEDWTLCKQRYLEHLQTAAPDVLLVSAADKLHNARSILADHREHADELWRRFNRGARDQLWYYGALRDTFQRRMPGALADELDRTVRAIERRLDPADRITWLDLPYQLWATELGESGAFIDWPGCSLVVEHTDTGPQVRAHVGSGGWFDEETDLEAYVDVDLDGLRLEYLEPHEQAWLISDDHGNLRDACQRVATMAPLVTDQLREAGDLHPPAIGFEERLERGPWW